MMSSSSSPTKNIAETAALGLIKAYQYGIRPMLGQRCRFFPSCSEYSAEAITQYGVLRGSAMGAMRLSKCHPWHAGGFDPVPTVPCAALSDIARAEKCDTRSSAAVERPAPARTSNL
jgi:uncharacterized protein